MLNMFIQLANNGIIAGCIYVLISLGFTVIYRTVKFFHFAHGATFAIGAYAAYATITGLTGSNVENITYIQWALAIVTGMAAATITGLLTDRLVYYPLRRLKAPNMVFLIASFGVFILLQNLIQLIFGAQILTLRTGPVKEGHEFLGAIITDTQILIITVSLAVFLGLWAFVQRTKLGKAMRAVADDPVAASVVGIYPEKIITASFAIGSALAGLAGILISLETNLEPSMGMNAMLKGMTAAIIGGMGSIPGALLGGLLLGLAENFGIWHIQAGWKDAIAFGLLIVFLLFRPQGILGKKVDR
jgi:branched-chain amino acid transport system permease protein